jgi:hypothetical protein
MPLLYLPGLKNVVADFLSRQTKQPLDQLPPRRRQILWILKRWPLSKTLPETQHLLGSTSLKLVFLQTGAQCLAGDVSTGNFRPIVPLKFRKTINDNCHNIALTGRLASCCIISSRFVWRGLSSNVTAWACRCLACQRGKIHHHTHLVPQPIPIPQRQFSHLHVDLVGTLQNSSNFNYIFTIIDHTSKWMEAIPLSETGAAACPKALTFTWISRF